MPEYPPPTRLRLGVRLLWAGACTIDRSWDLPLRDPFWRLYRNREAGAVITWPGGSLALPPGRLVLVPAWGGFHGRCRGTVGHFYLHGEPHGLPSELLSGVPTLLAPEPARDALAAAVADGMDGSPAWWLRAQALMLDCLAALVAGLPPERRDRFADRLSAADPLLPALALVESSLAEPLAVAGMARHCGLGADRFARLFRLRHGITPAAYLRQRRITAAVELLRGSDEPIEAIAGRCGFANRYHFTRVFTAVMGTPPAAYRVLGRGQPAAAIIAR